MPDRRRSNSFLAEDAADREVASFAFGKGKADWGPLTVYAVMKSGDVYAICPYMPKNAYVGTATLSNCITHILQCNTFVLRARLGVFRSRETGILTLH